MTLAPPLFTDPAPRAERLEIALSEGLALPDGPVTVLHPRAGESFAPLDPARLHIVTGFRPDHDAFAQAGYSVALAASPAPVVLVCLPRGRADGLALIAEAVDLGAELVLVDGQKTDGIEAMLKALRARVTIGGVISKAHGKLVWFAPQGADFSDWRAMPHQITDPALGQFHTLPGVFSADGVDPGSALLAQHLPETLPARMADLGAGWGYLSAACLARKGVQVLHLVEAEARALELARQNISDPRAQFHWADACTTALPDTLDGVVMNPPFHTGRKPQPALGLAFIASAARLLHNRGKLWMVANRHLPYEGALAQLFTSHEMLAETSVFRVWQAVGPRRKTQTVTRSRRQG
jgi:16S rRNA (guanine1207-N2)-methyltransferase